MHDATSPSSRLRLAIAPGVPSPRLSALLALQRDEEPEVAISFFEVSNDKLATGLDDDRYDAGITLQPSMDSAQTSLPLWVEPLAIALPPRFSLLARTELTITELLDYPVFRWPAECCLLLDQRLSSLPLLSQQSIQPASSFEMLALWVSSGNGIGISAQLRIQRAAGWGIEMRPLSGGPYEVITHLQRLGGQAHPVIQRFERRALQVARATVVV